MIDRIIILADRHERLVAILGAAWLALGCAVYAKFIVLPDLPFLTDDFVLYSGAAYNALWWGFVRPAIERRKQSLPNRTTGSPAMEETRNEKPDELASKQ